MQFNLKYLWIIYMILTWNNKANGQSSVLAPPSIPSPNATSLGLYGEVPVSHYTGLPNITIPLYQTKGQSLSIPISLDYHASGNRPEQQPGWVGLGWNLTVGGAITRTVKQIPDEYNIGFDFSGGRKLGHYWWSYVGNSEVYPGYLSDSDWSDNTHMLYNPLVHLDNPIMDYAVDREPDEFTFNFLGYSGTFYLDQNHQWKVRSDRPLKVEFDNQFVTPFISPLIGGYHTSQHLSKTFKHFTIIDEFGNKYIFGADAGDNDHAIEYSTPLESFTDGQLFYANTWYLTKIVSANQSEVIYYEYERGPFISSASYNYTTWSIGQGGGGFFEPPCADSGIKDGLSGSLISPVYLKEVAYPKKDLKIRFNFSKRNDHKYDPLHLYSAHLQYDGSHNHLTVGANATYIPFFQRFPGDYDDFDGTSNFIWVKLNNIVITDLYETVPIRKINFSYTESSTSRLKLNAIQLTDNADTTVQKYSFDYNSVQLPPYLMSITDHWGFNTGRVLNEPLTNKYQNLSVFYSTNAADLLSSTGVYRTPGSASIAANKAEILEMITYPTGGKTIFEYELHDYNKSVSLVNRTQIDNATGYAGGLRIKKITNLDIEGQLETKQYYYKRGYTPNSNVENLASSGVLNVKPTYSFSVPKIPAIYFPQLGANFYYTYKVSAPIVPLALNSSGIHVGYSEVVEKRSDGSYTIFKYTNHDVPGYTDPEPVNEFPILSTTSEMTRYIRYRSTKNDRGKLLASEVYTNTGKLLHKKEIEYVTVGNTATDVVRAVFWRHTNACDFSPTQVSMGILSSIAYTIPLYRRLPSIEKEYVYNQQDSSYVYISKSYTYDQTTKLLKTVQSTRSNGKSDSTIFYYTKDFAADTPYNDMLMKNMLNFLVKREEMVDGNLIRTEYTNYKKWHSNVYAPETIQFKVGNAGIQNKLTFHSYDVNGNPTESSEGNGGIRNASLWGYQAMLPTAVIKNARHTDVFYTSFEEGDGNNYETDSKTGNVNHVGTYNKTLTGLNSGLYNLTYWKKNNNAWNQIRLHNINVTDTYTINLSGQIDEVRFYPLGALMTTYTYDPLIGMNSSMDARGNTTYYEYDSFQRLIQIRDAKTDIVANYAYNYGYKDQVLMSSEPNWQDLGGRRCVTLYGGNTGEQQRQLTDINYYSATYKQTKWESMGITGNCELPVIYARLEYHNSYSSGGYNYSDIYIAFYSDENATTPLMINRPLSVNYSVNNIYHNWSDLEVRSLTLPAGTISYKLGTEHWDDDFTDMMIYYLDGGNYVIIP